jgi:hypothetical protein
MLPNEGIAIRSMSQGELTIELRAGSSKRSSMSLRPGEAVEPLSLGRRAAWQIFADGVADVHAFIYFDGEAVFVASADANNRAVAGGALIGTDWTEIIPPCELRLGRAMVVLRLTDQPTVIGYTVADTRPDAGSVGAWERRAEMDFDDAETSSAKVDSPNTEVEHRRRKPRIKVPHDDDEPTRPADPSHASAPIVQRKSRRKPKIKVPSAEEATRYNPIEDPATVPWRDSQMHFEAQPVATEPGPFPAVPSSVPGAIATAARQRPAAEPMPDITQPIVPMTPGFVPPGVGHAPAWTGQQPIQRQGSGAISIGTQAPSIQGVQQAAGSRPSWVTKVVDGWKGASLPQKAILCLLPIAFAAVGLMFDDDNAASAGRNRPKTEPSAIASPSAAPLATASAPSSASTAQASSASTTSPALPSSAPSSGAVVAVAKATTASGASEKGPRPTTGKGAPSRTLARQASDAVAAGSYGEALKVYEQLATEHPEMPVYREAARILRAKMAEPR